MLLNNQRLIMKKMLYIAPECDNFKITYENNLLELVLSVSNEETEIVGSNNMQNFEEDNSMPSSSSLWDEN